MIHENIVIGQGYKERKYSKALSAASAMLAQGESVLAIFEAGTKLMTTSTVITNMRLLEFDRSGKCLLYANLAEFDSNNLVQSQSGLNLTFGLTNSGTVKYKFFGFKDSTADQNSFIQILSNLLGVEPPEPVAPIEAGFNHSRDNRASEPKWVGTNLLGPKLSKKASEALERQKHDSKEMPWLIINTAGFGILAAFEDRAVIIKAGFWTSMGAGSLGGERTASFNFHDITGVEYNAGMMNGVLEILTASYSGTKNQDFWKGTLSSTNSNSSNPATLSNTLLLSKSEYREYSKQIGELRKRIADSKKPQVVAAPVEGKSLAAQILELKELLDSGIITDQEFNSAKAKLIS